MHSVFSDGSLQPQELVEEGRRIGLTGMALTDHDTTAGVAAFMAARPDGMVLIPGVEISAEVPGGTLHMLGYHIEPGESKIQEALARIRGGREDRNARILARLHALGMEIDWDEVADLAGDEVVGRPHFAQAMLMRGYVKSKQDAFDRFLAKGKPAYEDRFRLPPEEGIRLIRGAGGVAVLAHPFTLGLARSELSRYVSELADRGLEGIEVYYSEHSQSQTAEYGELASSLGLVATGGSDFHGAANEDIRLGVGFGGLRVPDSILEELERRRKR